MKLPVLLNPGGGNAGLDAAARIRAALGAVGLDPAIEEVAGPDLEARAGELANRGVPIIAAAGGDGTLSAVGGVLAGTGTALGILPLGTLNHFARDLGIGATLDQAATVLAAGHRRAIDLACVNDRSFVNNSSIGLYPLLIDSSAAGQARGWSKRRAMLAAAARTLARMDHYRLRLSGRGDSGGGGPATIDTPLLFVGNNDYAVALPAAGRRQSLDDGRLCVMVLRRTGRLGLLAVVARALAGRSRPDDMVRIDAAGTLTVDSARSTLSVACDGETFSMTPPLVYRLRPRALIVVAPPPASTSAR